MKRSAALIALSREHHGALVLARRIGDAGTGPDCGPLLQEIRTRHRPALLAHFADEERRLPPVLCRDDHRPLLEQLLAEHQQLRALLTRLADGDRQALEPFGILLARHVRFEERTLFPQYEAVAGGHDA